MNRFVSNKLCIFGTRYMSQKTIDSYIHYVYQQLWYEIDSRKLLIFIEKMETENPGWNNISTVQDYQKMIDIYKKLCTKARNVNFCKDIIVYKPFDNKLLIINK